MDRISGPQSRGLESFRSLGAQAASQTGYARTTRSPQGDDGVFKGAQGIFPCAEVLLEDNQEPELKVIMRLLTQMVSSILFSVKVSIVKSEVGFQN